MKKIALMAALAVLMAAAPAFAAVKDYQVTGPVVELTPEKLVVAKGKENWELARGGAVVPDSVKVGSKVTVHYVMTVKAVEAKEEKTKPPKK